MKNGYQPKGASCKRQAGRPKLQAPRPKRQTLKNIIERFLDPGPGSCKRQARSMAHGP